MVLSANNPTSRAAELLIRRGRKLFNAQPIPTDFANHEAADRLINDLSGHPHAFVLGCVMDRQIRAERAWRIPYEFADELKDSSFEALLPLSLEQIRDIFNCRRLHRFPDDMARNFFDAVRRIENEYQGDASKIWADKPPSARVVRRFLAFRGVGPKIATMAANLLACHFKVLLEDYYSVDISADVHVRRVFERIGFTGPSPSVDEVIYTARELNPQFPGLLDFATWTIGKAWCHSRKPDCFKCFMKEVCRFAEQHHAPPTTSPDLRSSRSQT